MSKFARMALISLAVAVGGCFQNRQHGAIRPQASIGGGPTVTRRHATSAIDQAAPPMYDNVRIEMAPRQPGELSKRDDPVAGVSEAVQEAVHKSPLPSDHQSSATTKSADLQPQPFTSPAPSPQASTPRPTTFPGASSGTYLTLGAVVTEVSGQPIFANKILSALTPLLATEARQKDEAAFRTLARREIERQAQVMIRTELEFAAADKNLSKNEKDIAQQMTMRWRQRQVTEAGGSLELARRKAAQEGIDLDQLAADKYREFLVALYYQKKIYPQVQVTAQDMRDYYNRHLKDEFTVMDEAQFRLIRIESRKMGGRDKALDKIRELHERAVRGEDFAELAKATNHDPGLMRNAGDVGWIQRGAFAVEKVEDAVWQLHPGQVSDIIEVGDAFFVAKLEQRKQGRVQPFEEPAVQTRIKKTLESEQVLARRQKLIERLIKESVIYPDPPVIDPVIEMAMQKYPQWASIR